MTTALPFRFDPGPHHYIDVASGVVLPHITGMLQRTGWVDDTWFTEASCDRGTAVHRLTADYDLGALDVGTVVSKWSGYLQAHIAALTILQAEVIAVEEPIVHPVLRFGGRLDRRVRVRGAHGVMEVKSGVKAPTKTGASGYRTSSHHLQTALQAILAATVDDVTLPESLLRFCVYLKPTGKFAIEAHTDRGDFDEARRIIRQCVGR